MFSMLTLILGNNYAMMFVGWEGVGLCSYLLIGFYFHKHSASTAANKAFIVNRIGDAGFLMGMFTIAWLFGTVRFTGVQTALAGGNFEVGDPIIPMPRASRYAIQNGEHLVRHPADVDNTLFLTARTQVEVCLVRD
jgi:NADH:ubiquinone oxidoreductase subunit 5 (subunit L)/multisubunit Na+/H+ antiporter MnhA subunit